MTTDPTPGIDLWTAPISADGATATPEQMRKAWMAWCHPLGFRTATGLAAELRDAGLTGSAKFWPTARIADRMLQCARKAGVIRYVKRRWEIVESSDAG